MQFSFACFLLFLVTGFVSTEKQCRMPNGYVGECKLLKKCKPLYDLNKKRVKSEQELLYLRQSSCGVTSSFQQLICCPPEVQWTNFKDIKPVILKEIMEYNTDFKETPKVDTGTGLRYSNDEKNDKVEKHKEDTKYPPDFPMQNDKSCGKDFSNANRIKGGGAAAVDQFPWLVLLEYENGQTLCGGSLITKKFILTAAHCIKRTSEPKFARLAEYNTSSYPTDYVETDGGGIDEVTVEIIPIEKNLAHPNYTRLYVHHDIGLSKLKRDAVLGDFIRLICLPTQDFRIDFKSRVTFTVAGWGSDGNKFSDVKKYVTVPYVPAKECQASFSLNRIIEAQICAGGREGEDSCSGDSGGPLMYEHGTTYVAIGIVSYGLGRCGTDNTPAIYTYVYSYLDWLRNNMV
ncbi:unnamed protein product [Parnassius apollo]|uniref:(apollo) hypothetical protein n=1 Tax=Parnassius apollo TaxID=110799 RepID=A0A8S3XMF4_PARAO|nr:unnamed protein product [Parnassius apollo]